MRRVFRKRRLEAISTELNLAAMVDMMVNILLFLLTFYGTATTDAVPMELAESVAKEPVSTRVQVAVTVEAVRVEGQPVVALRSEDGALVAPEAMGPEFDDLRRRLETARVAALTPDGMPPVLAVQVDRRVPWAVLKPVMAAATAAGWTDVRFVVNSVGSREATPGQ